MVDIKRDKMIHPMSYPSDDLVSDLFIISRGDGCYVFDRDDKKYIDAQAGLWCVNVGHNNKKINDAINEQTKLISYYNTFENISNEPCMKLSEKIIDSLKDEKMSRVFYSSGGSDSVDTALKLSRLYWRLKGFKNKYKFLSFQNGYHGLHAGGTSINGISVFKEDFTPLVPGCVNIPYPNTYNLDNVNDADSICKSVIENVISTIEVEGANSIAALISEPIQGVGGVIIPTDDLWPELRKICDDYNILLIADEVITGYGRSGSMFGVRHWNVKPDMMCLAKGLTSGYMPLGATVINDRIVDAFRGNKEKKYLTHGYTYSGHPLSCAAAVANIEFVEELDLSNKAKMLGEYFKKQLLNLSKVCLFIGEVRVKGLMIALDIVDPENEYSQMDDESEFIKKLKNKTLDLGLIVRFMGSTIIISPPLIISEDIIDNIITILDESFKSLS